MTFADMMASDLANTFFNVEAGEFAESITYTPSIGDPKSIAAQVERDDETVSYGEQGQGRDIARTVYIRSDATLGVAAPVVPLDAVTIDGLQWTVMAAQGPQGGVWKLTVRRHETDEVSGGDHRVRR
jgi:hypothetical protein